MWYITFGIRNVKMWNYSEMSQTTFDYITGNLHSFISKSHMHKCEYITCEMLSDMLCVIMCSTYVPYRFHMWKWYCHIWNITPQMWKYFKCVRNDMSITCNIFTSEILLITLNIPLTTHVQSSMYYMWNDVSYVRRTWNVFHIWQIHMLFLMRAEWEHIIPPLT